jgi:2-polyprenyl-3-methyl-5-hydroxy-6-metoxy-1,4-benzoquinol methylase
LADTSPQSRTHLDLVGDYFDRNAGEWSDLYRRVQRVNDIVLVDRKNTAVAELSSRVPSGGRILDAGCGAGLAALDLAQRGYFVHGADVAAKMLDLARRNLTENGIAPERFALSCGDVASFQLPAGSFDGVAALGFLQYQPDERVALREFHRLLKPGGVIVITGPTQTKLSNYFGLARYYHGLRRRLWRKPAAAPAAAPGGSGNLSIGEHRAVLRQISPHAYGYGRFRELLHSTGFRVARIKGHGFVHFEIIGKHLGFRGEMFLHRFFSGLSKVLPIGRFANDIIVVAERI